MEVLLKRQPKSVTCLKVWERENKRYNSVWRNLCCTGLEGFDIGDTIADAEEPEGLTPIQVDEPTMSMTFVSNNSPFFDATGKFVTSRQVRDRLFKEIEKNLALRVEETDSADKFLVYGVESFICQFLLKPCAAKVTNTSGAATGDC